MSAQPEPESADAPEPAGAPDPGHAPEPAPTVLRPDAEHIRAACRLVADRYPEALAAVLGGSGARGLTTPTSDLDLAVLLPDDGTDHRRTLRHDGRVAEVFLHTRAGLREIFASDRGTRRATMLFIYAESVPLHDPHGHAAALRAQARSLLAAGPDPLTAAERDSGRYALTDLLEDLHDTACPGSDRFEQLAIAERVLGQSAHLLTAHRRAWNGAGKWLPRRLLAADPVLGEALLRGHLAVAEQADPMPLAGAARDVLDLLGGPLREGYVQNRKPSL